MTFLVKESEKLLQSYRDIFEIATLTNLLDSNDTNRFDGFIELLKDWFGLRNDFNLEMQIWKQIIYKDWKIHNYKESIFNKHELLFFRELLNHNGVLTSDISFFSYYLFNECSHRLKREQYILILKTKNNKKIVMLHPEFIQKIKSLKK